MSMFGGGAPAKPGEVSMAEGGILFLDELPQFRRIVLEGLREPLEHGFVTLRRAGEATTLPAVSARGRDEPVPVRGVRRDASESTGKTQGSAGGHAKSSSLLGNMKPQRLSRLRSCPMPCGLRSEPAVIGKRLHGGIHESDSRRGAQGRCSDRSVGGIGPQRGIR